MRLTSAISPRSEAFLANRAANRAALDAVRSAGGHSMVTAESTIVDASGEHVVTAISTLVVRGDE